MEVIEKKTVIIICGDELTSKNITGIPRYLLENLRIIDENIDNSIAYEIRLCYPAEKEINIKKFNNIKLVPLKSNNRPFRSKVLVEYAKTCNGVLCLFSPSICRYNKTIMVIHDIRPLERISEDSLKYKIFNYLVLFSLWLHPKCKIVTVSKYQSRRIKSILHSRKRLIEVIGNGWEHILNIKCDYNIFEKYQQLERNNYFLSIGSVAKHKNYEWIFHMALKYPEEIFVIAGNISRVDWNYDNTNLKLDNVIFTGYITDEECKALLMECKALLHPSKYEGFGIPPLEALALGKKIIISNATCLPEIYGKSAIYFNPDDFNFDLINALKEDTEKEDMVLRKHSWRNSGKLWVNLFEKI